MAIHCLRLSMRNLTGWLAASIPTSHLHWCCSQPSSQPYIAPVTPFNPAKLISPRLQIVVPYI